MHLASRTLTPHKGAGRENKAQIREAGNSTGFSPAACAVVLTAAPLCKNTSKPPPERAKQLKAQRHHRETSRGLSPQHRQWRLLH